MKIQFNSKGIISTEEKVEKAVDSGKIVIRINWGAPKAAGEATYLTSNQGAFRVNTQDGSVFLKFNPWTVQYVGVNEDDKLVFVPNTPFVEDGEGKYVMTGEKVQGFMAYLLAFVSKAAFEGKKLTKEQKEKLLQYLWSEVSLNLDVGMEKLVSLRGEAMDERGSGIYRSAVIAFEPVWNRTSHRLNFVQGEVLSWEEDKFTLVQGNSVSLNPAEVMKAARDLTVKNPWGNSKVEVEDVFEGMSKNLRRKQERYGKYLEKQKAAKETPPVEKKEKKKREPSEDALRKGFDIHGLM